MSSSVWFETGDMVALGGPRGTATGDVVSVEEDLVIVRVTGDVRPDDVADLEAEAPGAALPEAPPMDPARPAEPAG